MGAQTEISWCDGTCRVCGHKYIHRGKVDIFDADWNEDKQAYGPGGIHVTTDGMGKHTSVGGINVHLEGCEHLVRIQFNCERGCSSVLRIAKTNGITRIGWSNERGVDGEPIKSSWP